MTALTIALAIVAAVFAIEMGGSGLAPSFSVALGSGIVSRRRAVLLFAAFVLIGAVLFGSRVARTLGGALVPAKAFDLPTTLIGLGSAALALAVANRLRIPQSTSWVSVGAVVMIGIHHGEVNTRLIFTRLLPAWILLPLCGFALTWLIAARFYPLRPANMRLHEALPRHARALRFATLLSSCYVALAIGSTNVAHVVGPLTAAGLVEPSWGLAVVAPFFGLGALLLAGPSRTVGHDIVPVGLLTAAVVNLLVGTLVLSAAFFGVPQSLVQLNTACVLAVSRVKEGSLDLTAAGPLRRIGLVWAASPAVALTLTWLLLTIVGLLRR